MNMFCSTKSKNRKSHPAPTNGTENLISESQSNININLNSRTSDNNNNNSCKSSSNSNIIDNQNTNDVDSDKLTNNFDIQPKLTTNPCRYVIDNFTAVLEDELSVSQGDIVFHKQYDGDWSYVVSLESSSKGFVPSSILSLEPPKRNNIVEPKKKLNRSNVNEYQNTPTRQQFQNSVHNLSSHHNSVHQLEQHTLQNHQRHNPINRNYHNTQYEFKPFRRENFGLFMVTNNFIAREENDLSVKPGDYLILLNKDDDDWYWVKRFDDHKEGFVPSKFICDYEQVKAFLNKGNSTVTMKSSNNTDFHTYMNQIDHKMQGIESPIVYH